MPSKGTGVDAADPDHALGRKLFVECAARPPAARDTCGVTDDVAADPDPARLGILVVDAGVADVRRGLDDHLTVVRRVGQCLLVAGHPGVEDRFPERLALGAVRLPAKRPAVLENENCGGHRHPSSTLLGELHKSRPVCTWMSNS